MEAHLHVVNTKELQGAGRYDTPVRIFEKLVDKMIYTSKPVPTNVGQFLSEVDGTETKTFERVSSVIEDKSVRFRVQDRNFNRQYAHLYAERLWTTRPKLMEAARAKWGELMYTLSFYSLLRKFQFSSCFTHVIVICTFFLGQENSYLV